VEFFYDNNRDGVWDPQRAETPRIIRERFVPVVLDSYLTGTPAEKAFVDRLGRGGTNCLVVAAASGMQVGTTTRPGELMPLVEKFRALPESERKPRLEEETGPADPSKLPPELPKGGLALTAYQVSLVRERNGELVRAPNIMAPGPCWPLKVPLTMSDLVWGTAEESRALLSAGTQKGQKALFPPSLFQRIAMTQAYDWMCGYQNSILTLREGELSMTVEEVTAKEVRLRIEGFSKVGGAEEGMKTCACESQRSCPHWGCELRYYGTARIDRSKQALSEFRVVGLGDTWTKVRRADSRYGAEVVRYPTGILLELPADVPANRGGWPPLAPARLNANFDYWGAVRPGR